MTELTLAHFDRCGYCHRGVDELRYDPLVASGDDSYPVLCSSCQYELTHDDFGRMIPYPWKRRFGKEVVRG